MKYNKKCMSKTAFSDAGCLVGSKQKRLKPSMHTMSCLTQHIIKGLNKEN